MNKLKVQFIVISVIAALLTTPVTSYAADVPSKASISLSSTLSEVNINQELPLQIVATESSDLYGYEFYVTYDPKVFVYQKAVNTPNHSIFLSSAASKPGHLHFSIINNGSTTSSVKLGEIVFKAIKSSGESSVQINAVKAIKNESIVTEKNGKYYASMAEHPIEGNNHLKLAVINNNSIIENNPNPTETPQLAPTPVPEQLTDPTLAAIVSTNENNEVKLEPVAVPVKVSTTNATSTALYAYEVTISNNTPIETEWPITGDVDQELVGLYFFNEETNKWEYVQGTKKTGTQLEATLSKSGQYAVMEYVAQYSDTSGVYQEAQRAITVLSAKHIIQGVSEEEFAPNKTLTRAEWTTMLIRATGLTKKSDTNIHFSDISEDTWYKDALETAASHQLITGYEDGSFKGNKAITRADLAVLIARLGLTKNSETLTSAQFADDTSIPAYALDSVQLLSSNGLLKGFGDGTFRPTQSSTRAEAAILLLRLLQN